MTRLANVNFGVLSLFYKVALALNAQILPPEERVPVEEWDRKPDLIYTPSGVLQIEQDVNETS